MWRTVPQSQNVDTAQPYFRNTNNWEKTHLQSVGCTDVGPVDGGRPPECEATVGDLIQSRPLSIGQLLPLHGLLKAAGLFPLAQKQRGLMFLQ